MSLRHEMCVHSPWVRSRFASLPFLSLILTSRGSRDPNNAWDSANSSDRPDRGSRKSSPTKHRATSRSGRWATPDDDRFYSQPRRSPSLKGVSVSSSYPYSLQQPPPPRSPPASPTVDIMRPEVRSAAPIEPICPPPPLPPLPDFLKRSSKEASSTEREDVWKERFRWVR